MPGLIENLLSTHVEELSREPIHTRTAANAESDPSNGSARDLRVECSNAKVQVSLAISTAIAPSHPSAACRKIKRDAVDGILAWDGELRELRAVTPEAQRAQAAVDRALAADTAIDFRVRTRAAADLLATMADATAHYRHLVRRVAVSFSTDRDRRASLIDALARATARTAETAQ